MVTTVAFWCSDLCVKLCNPPRGHSRGGHSLGGHGARCSCQPDGRVHPLWLRHFSLGLLSARCSPSIPLLLCHGVRGSCQPDGRVHPQWLSHGARGSCQPDGRVHPQWLRWRQLQGSHQQPRLLPQRRAHRPSAHVVRGRRMWHPGSMDRQLPEPGGQQQPRRIPQRQAHQLSARVFRVRQMWHPLSMDRRLPEPAGNHPRLLSALVARPISS